MGHGAKAFLGNQLARHAVNAVGLVLDAHESSLKALYEFLLAACHAYQLFFRLCHAAFLKRFVGWGSVVDVVAVEIPDLAHHRVRLAQNNRKFGR